MKKIGMGLIGPGFVAAHHLDAVRRLGDVEIVAIAGSSQQSAGKKAREYKVDRAYGDYKALIADPMCRSSITPRQTICIFRSRW
jgi:predicted dehydrogenase